MILIGSCRILLRILRDPTGTCIGSCRILIGSCRILQDPVQDPVGSCTRSCRILIRILQDPVGSCRILQDPNRILQDPVGSCRILQDPVGSCTRSCRILSRILQDPTGSYRILVQEKTGFYQDPTRILLGSYQDPAQDFYQGHFVSTEEDYLSSEQVNPFLFANLQSALKTFCRHSSDSIQTTKTFADHICKFTAIHIENTCQFEWS